MSIKSGPSVNCGMSQGSHPKSHVRSPLILTAEMTRASDAWMPDKESNDCLVCGAQFGMVRRRHHCRSCGILCCGACAPRQLVLLLNSERRDSLPKSTGRPSLGSCEDMNLFTLKSTDSSCLSPSGISVRASTKRTLGQQNNYSSAPGHSPSAPSSRRPSAPELPGLPGLTGSGDAPEQFGHRRNMSSPDLAAQASGYSNMPELQIATVLRHGGTGTHVGSTAPSGYPPRSRTAAQRSRSLECEPNAPAHVHQNPQWPASPKQHAQDPYPSTTSHSTLAKRKASRSGLSLAKKRICSICVRTMERGSIHDVGDTALETASGTLASSTFDSHSEAAFTPCARIVQRSRDSSGSADRTQSPNSPSRPISSAKGDRSRGSHRKSRASNSKVKRQDMTEYPQALHVSGPLVFTPPDEAQCLTAGSDFGLDQTDDAELCVIRPVDSDAAHRYDMLPQLRVDTKIPAHDSHADMDDNEITVLTPLSSIHQGGTSAMDIPYCRSTRSAHLSHEQLDYHRQRTKSGQNTPLRRNNSAQRLPSARHDSHRQYSLERSDSHGFISQHDDDVDPEVLRVLGDDLVTRFNFDEDANQLSPTLRASQMVRGSSTHSHDTRDSTFDLERVTICANCGTEFVPGKQSLGEFCSRDCFASRAFYTGRGRLLE